MTISILASSFVVLMCSSAIAGIIYSAPTLHALIFDGALSTGDADKLKAAFEASPEKPTALFINSPGGDFYTAMAASGAGGRPGRRDLVSGEAWLRSSPGRCDLRGGNNRIRRKLPDHRTGNPLSGYSLRQLCSPSRTSSRACARRMPPSEPELAGCRRRRSRDAGQALTQPGHET